MKDPRTIRTPSNYETVPVRVLAVVMDADDPADARSAERYDQNPVLPVRADCSAARNNLRDPCLRHCALKNAELDAIEAEILQVLDQSQAGTVVADIVQDHHDNIGHCRHLYRNARYSCSPFTNPA